MGNFKGYLIKIGSSGSSQFTFPMDRIEYNTFSVTRNTQDLDSKRTVKGILQRKALSHKPLSISFDLMAGTGDEYLGNILTRMKNHYINDDEKSMYMDVWCPETNGYLRQQKVYLASSTEFPIEEIDLSTNTVYYDTITFEFVGY